MRAKPNMPWHFTYLSKPKRQKCFQITTNRDQVGRLIRLNDVQFRYQELKDRAKRDFGYEADEL